MFGRIPPIGAIWVWNFLCGKVLHYMFNFFNKNIRTVHVFYFFAYRFWQIVVLKTSVRFIYVVKFIGIR